MKADRIVLGLTIMVVGVLWFLVNLGVLPAIQAEELWRYWPLLLVLWGLLMIFGKGSSGSGCLVSLLVILIIFGGFFAAFFPVHRGPVLESLETRIDNLYGATAVDVEIVQHAGEFSLSSHSGSNLMNLRLSGSYPPEVSHAQSGDTAEIKIHEQVDAINIDRRFSRWELTLPANLPAKVTLRVGGTKSEFDLRTLNVQQLTIKAGAGELTLWLGHYDTDITIENGAGNITIYVPEETGVRLRTSGGLMSVKGEHARVISVGERSYESDNLEQKDALADIRITAGAGAVTLKKK